MRKGEFIQQITASNAKEIRDNLPSWELFSQVLQKGETAPLGSGNYQIYNVTTRLPEYVLYADSKIVAINKPPGLNTHSSPFHPIGLIEIAREVLDADLYPAHRLDRDTSGVIVLAQGEKTLAEMKAQFINKRKAKMKKKYRAIMDGTFSSGERITAEVAIYQQSVKQMCVVNLDGEVPPAKAHLLRTRTHFKPLDLYETPDESSKLRSLVSVQLDTGKKHQIRVVAAQHLEKPITGDSVYNPDALGAPRQMLHAESLQFRNPSTGELMKIEAPLPEDFTAVLSQMNHVRKY